MDNLYMKGELLQVHTKNCEVFEGLFYSITSDKSKISLYNVKEMSQGYENDGITHYYNSEVSNIVKLQKPEVKSNLKISEKECEVIISISKKYLFINQVDNSFHKALEDLNQYSYISVSSDGSAMGRKCKMPFLVMATPHQIYIFDIEVMQYHAFDGGLKKILESEHPKKIVHDCRKLSDSLYHKHNVKLTSVFDTQVGDLIIQRNKQGRLPDTLKSLSACLNTYLGLQTNAVEEKLDIIQCTKRPLSTFIKETLAKNIAFLNRLSEIINEEMMLPFVRGVECFVENLRSSDDFKAWELCGKHHQLPKDFKSAIEY